MSDWIARLLDTGDFPPRWQCGEGWTDFLGWLHILSDLGIWAAYMAIPIIMWLFARRRRDLQFPNIFWLYVAFILLCGFTHLIEAIIFYLPIYRLSGLVKLMTAIVSLATVVALVQVMPRALTLPGLARINAELVEEVEARRRAEHRINKLIETSTSIVWLTNPDGQITTHLSGWARYTGQDYEAYAGHGWIDAIHPDDRERLMRDWQAAVRHQRMYQSYGRMWSDLHQSYRRFTARGVPIYDDAGRLVEWVGSCTDVEEQEQLSLGLETANLDLKKRNEQMRKFLYTVSHDLKSPVATMTGFADFLVTDVRGGRTDRVHHFVGRIKEAAVIMARSIDDLLQLSRLGYVPAKIEPVALGPLVTELARLNEPESSEEGSSVTVAADLPTLKIDAQHARHLFQNLLENALVHGVDDSGRAHVTVGWSVDAERDEVVLWVEDQGPGIPPQHHERVFELFTRLQNTTKGTGVGLSIVSQIVDNYGGSAEIQSPLPGLNRGCRFVLRFPRSMQVLEPEES